MKRLCILLLCALALLLSMTGCHREAEKETIPLLTAQNSYFADDRLYFCSDNYLSYYHLPTGDIRILCSDPLCSHKFNEDPLHANSECPALCRRNDSFSNILVDEGRIWFLATVYPNGEDAPARHQLRTIDLNDMSLQVYLEDNEGFIERFWKHGEDLYLLMQPYASDTENEHLFRMGLDGELEEIHPSPCTLLSSTAGGFYIHFWSAEKIQFTDNSFSSFTEVITLPLHSYNLQIHGEYLYYRQRTGEKVQVEGIVPEGEFDERYSRTADSMGIFTLCRVRLDGSGQEEVVYDAMPALDGCYYIDPNDGTIYVTPLDFACKGYKIWEAQPSFAAALGITKPILTNVFTRTGGRLIAIDPVTLEQKTILSGGDVDILAIYAIRDGQILGRFRITDPDRLLVLHGEENNAAKMGARWEYSYYGSLSFDNVPKLF